MKTSSDYSKKDTCSRNDINVSQRKDNMIYARVQKQIVKEALEGEINTDIGSIRDEMLSLLDSNDAVFENRYDKEDSIDTWVKRIYRYVNQPHDNMYIPEKADIFDKDSPILCPDENGRMQDTLITMFGNTVKVLPDFIKTEGNDVYIGRIKTSRVGKKEEDIQEADFNKYEAYALGLLGEKLYPHMNIHIEYDHLADSDAKTEEAMIQMPYDSTRQDRIDARLTKTQVSDYTLSPSIPFTEEVRARYEQAHEIEENDENRKDDEVATEDCASCPKYNICNYTEPPIPMALEHEVRPISDIHLTEEQRQAVAVREGTWRVNAGAGAGKTLMVAFRVKEMLKEGIDPKKILLITFTNNGALEMKTRVENYAEADNISLNPEDLKMTTFNAFCQDIINANYEELGFSKPPVVIPGELRMEEINDVLSKYPRISSWKYPRTSYFRMFVNNLAINQASKIFSVIKERGYTRTNNPWSEVPGNIRGTRGVKDEDIGWTVKFTDEDLDTLFLMYDEFDRNIKSEDYIEFADQINLVQKLYEMHHDLFEQMGYEHIIVDEAQDTDLPQVQLLQKMKDTQCEKSFMFVGDDSQAIYGFRHTSPEYMIHFGQYFGDGQSQHFNNLNLIENHRSVANIIDFANAINRLNTERVDKDLIATKPYEDDSVDVRGYYTARQEYKGVAEAVKRDIDNGMKPYDIAILARDNVELTKFASFLTKLNIPSMMMNPLPYTKNSNCAAVCTFFNSYIYKTTQGVMDYINAKEHGSLIAAAPEEINSRVAQFMSDMNTKPVDRDTFIDYVKELDPEAQDPCLQDFIKSKLIPCQTLDDMKRVFHALEVYGDMSKYKREGQYDGVTLITIHSAKGLEWDKVYYSVDKLDSKDFHYAFLNDKRRMAKNENERLNFVAASRARNELVCTGKYTISDAKDHMVLNDFLRDAYTILGKPYEFQSGMVDIAKAQDKLELAQETENARRIREQRAGILEENTVHEEADEIEGQMHLQLD